MQQRLSNAVVLLNMVALRYVFNHLLCVQRRKQKSI
jgi:hypothetical protein